MEELVNWIESPGFGGVCAVAAAAVTYWFARYPARQAHWWDRARWALDLTLSDDQVAREVGFHALDALQQSGRWSGIHESELVAAATEPLVNSWLVNDNGDGGDSGG